MRNFPSQLVTVIKYLPLFLFLACGQSLLFAQDSENVEVLDTWTDGNGTFYNDCWGYTAPDGSEYAIAGSRTKIYFFDFTDINNIQEIKTFQLGGNSSWRDFKTYGEFAYGVHDGYGTSNPEGLVIMDLTDIANGNITSSQDESRFLRAHNIFVDTATAKLYAVGTNSRNNGVIVYDVSDPGNPEFLSSVSLSGVPDGPASGYVHDIFVRNDTAYASHGNSGFWVWDFADPESPVLLGGIDPNGSGYNHSSWLTTDSKYSFWCEETSGRKIHVADVEDPENISVELQFNDPLLEGQTNLIAHNPFVKDDLLYISYYQDGVQIYDVSDPLNPTRVGYYDTEPDNTSYNGTRNNWGVYPYFSDNKMVATDTENGVFFLQYQEQFLPLELLSWNASLDGNRSALLKWETTQEINTSHFEIEYSKDGSSFDFLDDVPSKGSQQYNIYTLKTSELEFGGNYFRLKMLDQDGSFTYSDVRYIEFKPRADQWIMYPNPNPGMLQISGPWESIHTDIVELSVFNGLGQFVQRLSIDPSSTNQVTFPSHLPSGFYAIVLSQDGVILNQQTIQFIR